MEQREPFPKTTRAMEKAKNVTRRGSAAIGAGVTTAVEGIKAAEHTIIDALGHFAAREERSETRAKTIVEGI